jgi:hypothetical protein
MRANAARPQTDCSPRKQREPIPESLLGPLEQRVVADGVRMDPDQNQLRLTFPGNAKDRRPSLASGLLEDRFPA